MFVDTRIRTRKGEGKASRRAILRSSPRSKFWKGIPFESDRDASSIVSDGDESLNDRFRRWLRIASPLDCDQLRHASMRKRNERKRGRVPFRVSPSTFVPSGIIDADARRGFLLGRGKFRSNFQRNGSIKIDSFRITKCHRVRFVPPRTEMINANTLSFCLISLISPSDGQNLI